MSTEGGPGSDQEKPAATAAGGAKGADAKKPRGRPWQPGESGNPLGRPAGGLSVQAALIRALNRPWVVPDGEEQGQTRTKLDQLARAMVDQAIGGSVPAAEWVGNRLEGRVASKVEISGETQKTVVVVPWRPASLRAIQEAQQAGRPGGGGAQAVQALPPVPPGEVEELHHDENRDLVVSELAEPAPEEGEG